MVIGMSFSEKYGSTITMVWTRSGYHGNGTGWWELPNNGNGSLPLPCVLWVRRGDPEVRGERGSVIL